MSERFANTPEDRPILILAAGLSRRMAGRDKLLEEIDGVPLIERVTGQACATGHPVYVALPAPPHPRRDALRDLPVCMVTVPDAEQGISHSLRAGLSELGHDWRAVMIVLADLPDLTTADMQAVFAAQNETPDALAWRGATAGGKPGHPTLLSRALLPRLMALTGDQGAGSVLRDIGKGVHLTPLPGRAALTDLDTPEDWASWRAERAGRNA